MPSLFDRAFSSSSPSTTLLSSDTASKGSIFDRAFSSGNMASNNISELSSSGSLFDRAFSDNKTEIVDINSLPKVEVVQHEPVKTVRSFDPHQPVLRNPAPDPSFGQSVLAEIALSTPSKLLQGAAAYGHDTLFPDKTKAVDNLALDMERLKSIQGQKNWKAPSRLVGATFAMTPELLIGGEVLAAKPVASLIEGIAGKIAPRLLPKSVGIDGLISAEGKALVPALKNAALGAGISTADELTGASIEGRNISLPKIGTDAALWAALTMASKAVPVARATTGDLTTTAINRAPVKDQGFGWMNALGMSPLNKKGADKLILGKQELDAVEEQIKSLTAEQVDALTSDVGIKLKDRLTTSVGKGLPEDLLKELQGAAWVATENEAQARGLFTHEAQKKQAQDILNALTPETKQQLWDNIDKIPPGDQLTVALRVLDTDAWDIAMKAGENKSPDMSVLANEKLTRLENINRNLGKSFEAVGDINRAHTAEMDARKAGALKNIINSLPPDADKTAISKALGKIKSPTWWDKFEEMNYASMMSSFVSIGRNIIGGLGETALQPPRKVVAGMADAFSSMVTGAHRTRYAHEGFADALGIANSLPQATKNAIDSFLTEGKATNPQVLEYMKKGKAIPGMIGKMLRFPLRGLTVGDEFVGTMKRNGELTSLAVREALLDKPKSIEEFVALADDYIKNPRPYMIDKALEEESKVLFKQPFSMTTEGRLAASTEKFLSQDNHIAKALKLAVIPFFSTPVKLFGTTMGYLAGPLNPRGIQKVIAGTAGERADAIGKMAVGSAISSTIAYYAYNGQITGRVSSDPNVLAAMREKGIYPYTLRFQDSKGVWHSMSYQGLEPFASWLGAIANYTEEAKRTNKAIAPDAVETVLRESGKLVAQQPYLLGVKSIIDIMQSKNDNVGPKFLADLTARIIPSGSLIAAGARAENPSKEPSGFVERLASKLPFKQERIANKLDWWGRPIDDKGTYAERIFMPFGEYTDHPSGVADELLSTEVFPTKIAKDYRNLNLSVAERNSVTRVEGPIMKSVMDVLSMTPEYVKLPVDIRQQTERNLYSKTREAIRTVMLTQKNLADIRKFDNEADRERYMRYVLVRNPIFRDYVKNTLPPKVSQSLEQMYNYQGRDATGRPRTSP